MRSYRIGVLWLCAPLLAQAHGMQVAIDPSVQAVTVRCLYSSGEPADVEVQIYSPDGKDEAFQTMRTDPRGFASFVPDSTGTWLLVADDGMGHRVVLEIPVDDDGASPAPAGHSWSSLLRYLGAAVLAIVLAAWVLRGRGLKP